jgi:hypothetical protein
VHYIPVTQSFEEVPELVDYLPGSEAGQRNARDVAEWGREWHGRALRKVGMAIYLYRLMLEIARVMDSERRVSWVRVWGKNTQLVFLSLT